MSSRTGLRGTGGRLFSSRSWFKVSRVPGANSAPSKAWRAEEASPNWTNLRALAARRFTSSPRFGASVGRRLLNLAQRPACSVSPNAPNLQASAWHRSSTCFRGTLPPRGGNWIILGRNVNNFHARWTSMKSPFTSPRSLSSNATRNAALNAPLRNTGTVRITVMTDFGQTDFSKI